MNCSRATLVVLWALSAGCSTYSDRVGRAARDADAGDYTGAISAMSKVLGVSSADELPARWGADASLAVLERGTLLQSVESYQESARNLSAAEQQLEILDLSRDTVGELGRYLYSDSAQPYKTPPTERLSLNAVNVLNYLARGDLDGAAVEARRFQVMREFLESQDVDAAAPAGFGTYLAGFVFESRGEGDRALRYYEETLAGGPLGSLERPVRQLAAVNPYRGPRLQALLAKAPPAQAAAPNGEILVVLCLGRVPHKVPERIPVGLAIGLVGTSIARNPDWLKIGATKVVVYPALVSTPSSLGRPLVLVDGQEIAVEVIADLGEAIRREYEDSKPLIIAAALTRVAARAAVAEGVRAAGNQQSDLLGDILSIFVEGLFVAVDRPDTRSWIMLPAHVLVARVPVAPGSHDVEVSFTGGAGDTRQVQVDVAPNGRATVVVTEPR